MNKSKVLTGVSHTPTPWKIIDYLGLIKIKTSEGSDKIASIITTKKLPGEDMANAEFIIKAVNNHEKLVEACKAQHKAIDWLFAKLIDKDDSFYPSRSPVWELMNKGNEALKEAGEI